MDDNCSFEKYGINSYDFCNYRMGYSYRKSEWPDRCMIDIANYHNTEIHPTFAEQAGIQLTKEIVHYTGIENIYKIVYCIHLFYELNFFNEVKPIEKNGYSFIVSQIYTDKGCRFYIKWKSLIKDKDYIEMSDKVDENSVKFEIVTDYNELPKEFLPFTGFNWVEKLHRDWKTLAPKRKKKEKTGYNFELETLFPEPPDINLTLSFSKTINDDINSKVKDIIVSYIEEWNAISDAKKRKQYIHDGGIIDHTENTMTVWMDFGSASQKALNGLLQELSNADLDIELISVG